MNVKELAKRMFLEDPNSLHIKMEEHKVVLPVEEMFKNLVDLPTEVWDRYAFCREPLRDHFQAEDRMSMATAARDNAVACARDIMMRYTGLSVPDLARKMGVKVEKRSVPRYGAQVLFAQFQKPNTITLFTDCLDKFSATLMASAFVPMSTERVEMILLAHELYHYIETMDASLYSQSHQVQLWKIGPIANRSRVLCLGEIAAMAFAKTLTETTFEPFLLDVLLVYGYNPEAASNLYNRIMEMAQQKPF